MAARDKATSINKDSDPTKMKAKVEGERPSSDGSSKGLLENRGGDEYIDIEHQSKAESSAENLRHGVILDYKQNDEKTSGAVCSVGLIIQFAGKG